MDDHTVRLTVELTEDEAEQLAQFLKRVGFSDFRGLATSDQEAYLMRDATDRLRVALREVGFAPR